MIILIIFFICFFITSKHIAVTTDYDNPSHIIFSKYSYEFLCAKKLKKLYEKKHKKFLRELEKLEKLENGHYNEHYSFWMHISNPKNLRYGAIYRLAIENNELVEYIEAIWKSPRRHTRHKDLVEMNKQYNCYKEKPRQHSCHGDHGSKGQQKGRIISLKREGQRKVKYYVDDEWFA